MSTRVENTSLSVALAILQQGEYEFEVFQNWWKKHSKRSDKKSADERPSEKTKLLIQVQPDKWTLKLKLIFTIATVLFFLPLPTRIFIALQILFPFEQLARYIYQQKAKNKLRQAQKNGLIIIAIAGSYAKTSTKQWIAHLLGKQTKVLSTGKSINTPQGIANTILSELKSDHTVFIVELGEYYPGDIERLASFINPDFGVITPIGHQHLERMKTIEVIAQTIGELILHFKMRKLTNNVISAIENAQYFTDTVTYFGNLAEVIKQDSKSINTVLKPLIEQKMIAWQCTNASITTAGTQLTVSSLSGKTWDVFTPLYGVIQCSNALPAFWIGEKITTKGILISLESMAKAMATMPYVTQRLEPHFAANNVLILDNSYNTNPDSFPKSLELLEQLKPSLKIVITLGFVELGEASPEIHRKLGEVLAQKTDYLGIIESDQAKHILDGFFKAGGKKSQVIIESTPETCMQALQKFVIPGTVILFEGGYREVLI